MTAFNIGAPLSRDIDVLPGQTFLNQVKTMPSIDLTHLLALTDDTGIIQHAVRTVPNRKEGYCLDDNARALMLTAIAASHVDEDILRRLQTVYLGFIYYMQNSDGYFRNFMSYTRHFMDERGSEDAMGRTVMALSYLMHVNDRENLAAQTAEELFLKAINHAEDLDSPRAIAGFIIGISQFIRCRHPDDIKKQQLIRLTDKLVRHYQLNSSDDWQWFEESLTYDNAVLPLALFHAYEISLDKTYLAIACESLYFLESKVWDTQSFTPIGNQGWYTKSKVPALYDQQAVDTMMMLLLYHKAYQVTKDQAMLKTIFHCYTWFTGVNSQGVSLYDPTTGGCFDGLHKSGVNLNQGAESTIAYWVSHFTVLNLAQLFNKKSL